MRARRLPLRPGSLPQLAAQATVHIGATGLGGLAQNYYICASTPAQIAALACFTPESIAVCEARRQEFAQRRALVLQGLDAMSFCERALQEAHVRLSYAASQDELREGLLRLRRFVQTLK